MSDVHSVWDVASKLVEEYGKGELMDKTEPNAPHEANLLMLNTTKAHTRLGWKPRLNFEECEALTVNWYKRYKFNDVYSLCMEQINKFTSYK